MKKFFFKYSSLLLACVLLTACALNGTEENKSEIKGESPQTEIEQLADFHESEPNYLPMPDYSTGKVNEDNVEIQSGIVGNIEPETKSLDKWIVLLDSDEDNTVFFDSWKEAGEALGLDLSILNSDSHTVLFHGNLAEEVGADGNYCLLQSVIPSPEGSTPVSTEEEHRAMIEEYSLAPEIQCASVFIGKDPSENASPEEYRENFRSLGGEYAYKEIQSVNSKKVVLKETSIKEHNSDITFYTLPLDVSADGSDPNAEVNFCADITTDNCLMEVSFGTIIKSEAENAAEKMYELLSKSIS